MAYSRKTYTRRPVTKARLSKRWYVDASIPKSMPFIGGSSFKAGSGSLSKRSLQTLIRQNGEVKQKIVPSGNSASLLHNTLYTFNPFGNIPIQTGANGRLAQGIFVKDWTMNLLFTNFGGSSAPSHYRVLVVNTDTAVLSGSDAFASGLGTNDIFVQGSTLGLMSIPDSNRCSVISDTMVKIAPYITGPTQTPHTVNCCKNKTVKYLTPTSNYVLGKNTYLVIIPYTHTGTLGTTVIGTLQYESCVTFTDI